MTSPRRFARLALAATLVATVGSLFSVSGVFAAVTVGSAGTVAPGGTSSGTVSFTFAENSINAFPNVGGTLSVNLADSLGVPSIHFAGQPSIAASATTPTSIVMGPALTSFTLTIGSSSATDLEQIVVSGVALTADQGAAPGAITATLGGTLQSAVSSTTALTSPGTVSGTATGTHLGFTVQPGGGAAGTAWAQQPTVSVLNATNNTVTTDNTTVVTLSIGTNPAGGVLTCTGGNTKTVVSGIATFSGCAISAGSTSPYTLVASASTGATSVTSSTFLITGTGTARHLTFTTQPGGGTAGTTWAQQPTVAVQDPSNATVSADNTTVVTLSIGTNPGGGTLSCASGTSKTVVAGVATFSGCSINNGSTSGYTLVATSSGGATSATSSSFLITNVVGTVTLVSATAIGNTTTGFSTSTKVVPKGAQITLRIITSPSLAGQKLSILIAKKTGSTWSAFSPHASVTVGAGGVAYYVYSTGSVAWLSFQAKFNGSTTFAPSLAPARQVRWT